MDDLALGDVVQPDRIQPRVLMLADHAVIAPDGKLYVNGGGVDQMMVQAIPGQLGLLYLVIRIRVPWHRTSEQLPFSLRILDADRSPVDPTRDPAIQGAVEVGRPPGARAGDELSASLVLPLAGFPVPATGTLFFHVLVAGETLGVLPLKVAARAPLP